jgi:hypothetical protein
MGAERGRLFSPVHTCRSLPVLTDMSAAALACVLAFGVLSNDEPIEVSSFAIGQRGRHSPKDPRWTDVGVLLQSLTYGQAQAPELMTSSTMSDSYSNRIRDKVSDRDVIWDIGRPYGAKEDGVEFSQRVKSSVRYVSTAMDSSVSVGDLVGIERPVTGHARLLVYLGRPGEMGKIEFKATMLARKCLCNAYTGLYDLWTCTCGSSVVLTTRR